MIRNKTAYRKKIFIFAAVSTAILLLLTARLVYIMVFQSGYYTERAVELHERERDIKAARGKIVDRNGEVLAANRTVCTISVIHNQIKDKEKVIEVLSGELGISEETVRKRVEKYSSIERIKTNVDKELGDKIRDYELEGVKVDEDYKRYYPYDTLASKVLGFTGGDNQGIIGLEVMYEEYLKGTNGQILTLTDARGLELAREGERRIEPEDGLTLQISLDRNIQEYATQLALRAMQEKNADRVELIVMNPKNGEIYAMVNVPEFDLNEPYQLTDDVFRQYSLPENGITDGTVSQNRISEQDLLNQMWRNGCINDTYEPGSTFKIITASAALEEGVVSVEDSFHCPGFIIVEDRRIKCHKVTGHGAETFLEGTKNSCNPVFISVGLRLGAENFYKYFQQFGLLKKTGIDLPGEAGTIMHRKEDIGLVELATVSFGQSFQVTPVQLITTVSSLVNGGTRVTPHFGMAVLDENGKPVKKFVYDKTEHIVSDQTSETLKFLLEQVVADGSGRNAALDGYTVGGKTATSQTLPRSSNKYISSFIGFSPAEDPQVIALLLIHNPQGIYYGGTIAAPRIRELYENILPYLEIPQTKPVNEENLKNETNH